MIKTRRALIVRGGWEGHEPVEVTNFFIPYLRSHNFEIRVEESTKIYKDQDFLSSLDLIQQTVTMSNIEKDEFIGLKTAIEKGVGFAGWHGGIMDSFRAECDYLHLVGAQFACHPGVELQARVGDESDNFVEYEVNITEYGKSHSITRGLKDFSLLTEQYWILCDDYLDVLATTRQLVRKGDPWNRAVVSPAVFTRNWGKGRIFACTPGHNLKIVSQEPVKTIIERGLLWAAKIIN